MAYDKKNSDGPTSDGGYSKRSKKPFGKLDGPGSDLGATGLNDGTTSSLSGLLKMEDAKASRANDNLQTRLDEVKNLDSEMQGGFDSMDEDEDDQQE